MGAFNMAVSVCLLCCCVPIAETLCMPGYRLQDRGACVSCENGANFMPERDHMNKQCYNCSKLENPDLEILVAVCNRTHDALILCKPGYYRRKDSSFGEICKCEKCTECETPVKPCGGHSDTVCCSPNGRDQANAKDEPPCRERPILCVAGHYFSVKVMKCLLCPENTLMIESHHVNTACIKSAARPTTNCPEGSYLHINKSDGLTQCLPCNITNSTNNCINCAHLHVDNHKPGCKKKDVIGTQDDIDFQIFRILMFSLALPVDILYVYLFSNRFLKNTGYSPGRNRNEGAGKVFRIIGTVGVDVHLVLMCVHLFGILCEADVVRLVEDTRGIFIVSVGVVSIALYFADAVLFLFVTRMFCMDACASVSRPRPAGSDAVDSVESVQAFLDNT